MKVIVAGGRDFQPRNVDRELLEEFLTAIQCTEVVCGEAKGADAFGKQMAVELGIAVISFPAKWDDIVNGHVKIKTNYYGKVYNALAGFNRNQEMAEHADVLFAFPGGSGTQDMISRMVSQGKKVYTSIVYKMHGL